MAIDAVPTQAPGGAPTFPPAQAVDAYRTLQLAPSAPYELIEQAYWVLITRARRERSGDRRMGVLNDAYATLINPERRTAHDLEHGLTKLRTRPKIDAPKRPIFSRGPKYSTRLTHYQLLDLHPDASREVVDLAYAHRRTRLKGGDARTAYERALVEEAYQTLGDPERRDVYDERVMALRSAAPAPAPETSPVAPPRVVVEPVPVEPMAPAPVVAPPPVAPQEVLAEDGVAPAESAGIAAKAKRLFARGPKDPAAQELKDDKRTLRDAALAAQAAALAAEHKRLADLGLTAEPPPTAAPLDEHPATGLRTQFRFVGGPQAGEVINLSENSLILGASDAADVRLANPDGMIGAGHVRVWRREDEFILHQLDSFSTTYVNGERLDLRLAILEPGDEIRIGPHTLVFDQQHVESSPVAGGER